MTASLAFPLPTGRPSAWRRAAVITGPALTGAAVVLHPPDPTAAMDLAGRTGLWIGIHLALVLALPALAASVWLLLEPVHNRAATIARIALGPAIALYAAFDSLVGLGTGVLVSETTQLDDTLAPGAVALTEAWWTVPTPIAVISGLAQLSWAIVLAATAFALIQHGITTTTAAALVAAAALFPLLHVQPFGVLSMLLLAAAATSITAKRAP